MQIDQDILGLLGHQVVDSSGEPLGKLDCFYLDSATDAPLWVRVELPEDGRRHLVPLEGALRVGDELRVNFERELVVDSPSSEFGRQLSSGTVADLQDHYQLEGYIVGMLGPPWEWP
jgi:hypothetical protein